MLRSADLTGFSGLYTPAFEINIILITVKINKHKHH